MEYKEIEDSSLFYGHEPIHDTTFTPQLGWLGAKLPLELFNEAVAFCMWVYATWHSEAQVRLYYNHDKKAWLNAVLPQSGVGFYTAEDESETDKRSSIVGPLLDAGYMHFGSLHSHGGMSAFQSGTDLKDEEVVPGFHITVGNLDSDILSFHARLCRMGLCVEKYFWDVLELPFVDPNYKDALAIGCLARENFVATIFPEEWRYLVNTTLPVEVEQYDPMELDKEYIEFKKQIKEVGYGGSKL